MAESHPERSLTDTGTSVSARIAATREPISAGSRRSAAPQPVRSTLGTEQPQFRSMSTGSQRRDEPHCGSSRARGRGEDLECDIGLVRPPGRAGACVFALSRERASAETISVKHRQAPDSTQTERNGGIGVAGHGGEQDIAGHAARADADGVVQGRYSEMPNSRRLLAYRTSVSSSTGTSRVSAMNAAVSLM